MWKLRWNAAAVAGLSLMSTPRNRTPLGVKFWASRDSSGASARHGVHQHHDVPVVGGQGELAAGQQGPGDVRRDRARTAAVHGGARAAGHEALAVALRAAVPDRPAVAGAERQRAGQPEGSHAGRAPGARVPQRGLGEDAPVARASRQTGQSDLLQAVVPRPIVPDPASRRDIGSACGRP